MRNHIRASLWSAATCRRFLSVPLRPFHRRARPKFHEYQVSGGVEGEPRRARESGDQSPHSKVALAGVLLLAVLAAASTAAEPPKIEKVREIFVPYEDLSALMEGNSQRVFLTRQEYADLLAKANLFGMKLGIESAALGILFIVAILFLPLWAFLSRTKG